MTNARSSGITSRRSPTQPSGVCSHQCPAGTSARGTAPISRLAVVIVLAGSQVVGFGLGPVRGATTLPDEPGAIRLDGPSYAAIVADVDGDGVPELVRVTGTGGDGTGIGVEVWQQTADGSWDIMAPATPLQRAHGPDEAVFAPIDPNGLAPARVGDGVRLLSWHQAGKERVLAIVNAAYAASDAGPCCLTVWEVTQPAGAGPPILRLMANPHLGGGTVFSVDMDGDGTDELATLAAGGQNAPSSFSVLRWIVNTSPEFLGSPYLSGMANQRFGSTGGGSSAFPLLDTRTARAGSGLLTETRFSPAFSALKRQVWDVIG